MSDPRLETLAELGAALRELVGRLQDAHAAPGSIASAQARVDAALCTYRDQDAALDELAGEDRPRASELLSQVVRLHAVAASMAQRQADRTGQALEGVRRLRRGVADARPAGTGRACDVSG